MLAELSTYRRPWWLPNPYLETFWARRVRCMPRYTREIVTTFDNDIIAIDYLLGERSNPTLTIFHGLEGCSRSHTVAECAMFFHARGWNVFVPHFRTCGIMNRLPRAYHAGDSTDIGWMLNYVTAAIAPASRHVALGISLGGNTLGKWLGENPTQQLVVAAATVCAPFDLAAASRCFSRMLNRVIFEKYFLRTLRHKMADKIHRYPALATRAEINGLRTMRQFDQRFTAVLHGFTDADDYYHRASAAALLGDVATPLLCVYSDNDMFVPPITLPDNSYLQALQTRGGGHAGFVSAPFPGSLSWLPGSLHSFYKQML